jgi:2'-5' RNA ligase
VPDRVFVAIELDPRLRARFVAATSAYLSADPSWQGENPVAERLLHVTLAFLGTVPDASLAEGLVALAEAARGSQPFRLEVGRVAPVPTLRRATMLWASMLGDVEDATSLSKRLLAAGGAAGDDRPYRPHVTLVRSRRPRPVDGEALAVANRVLSDGGQDTDNFVSVRSASVFSSRLGPQGPAYEKLAHLELGGTIRPTPRD